jgi:hypothetical protein
MAFNDACSCHLLVFHRIGNELDLTKQEGILNMLTRAIPSIKDLGFPAAGARASWFLFRQRFWFFRFDID